VKENPYSREAMARVPVAAQKGRRRVPKSDLPPAPISQAIPRALAARKMAASDARPRAVGVKEEPGPQAHAQSGSNADRDRTPDYKLVNRHARHAAADPYKHGGAGSRSGIASQHRLLGQRESVRLVAARQL
jgi:hypothetical protein